MQILERLLSPADPSRAQDRLSLPFELRRRARLRTRLASGQEVAVMIERGTALRQGDRLASADGSLVVEVHAEPELLSIASSDHALLLTRAAYHLGNRHVALQIEPQRLCYLHDHVLDGMVRELGLKVEALRAPFEPELGGYAGAAESHHHHDHGHTHAHDHSAHAQAHEHDHRP